jgi:hypothetical protein
MGWFGNLKMRSRNFQIAPFLNLQIVSFGRSHKIKNKQAGRTKDKDKAKHKSKNAYPVGMFALRMHQHLFHS